MQKERYKRLPPMKKLKVFIGYDSKQDYSAKLQADNNPPYQVAKASILKHNSSVEVIPLKLDALKTLGLYYRDEDTSSTTEFTYSRFLVPYLSDYTGISVFCDSDFLWNVDITKVLDYINTDQSVACVKHDYTPSQETKMDGKAQTVYPRKNWSSLMVFNCEHPHTRNLTVSRVNNATPKYLHRFAWTIDECIGEIPKEYNWLEGEYGNEIIPEVIHYTNGGPWHETWDGDFKENWLTYFNRI